MNVVPSKVSSEIKGFLDWEISEILISESYDFALCNKKSELIFPRRAELTQLHACNLRASSGG